MAKPPKDQDEAKLEKLAKRLMATPPKPKPAKKKSPAPKKGTGKSK